MARWGRTGHELFFVSADGRLISTTVRTNPQIMVGESKELFRLATGWLDFDVLSEGSRFLAVVAPITGAGAAPLNVIVNWPASLSH